MKSYIELKQKHETAYSKLNYQYNTISILRLIVVVVFFICFYYYLYIKSTNLLIGVILLFVSFLILMKFHIILARKREMEKTLLEINADEINFLKEEKLPFENGSEFIDTSHTYSYDLDFFGEHSFFQNLNRTGTYIGKRKLAGLLLSLLTPEDIRANQDAVKDLARKLQFRQNMLAQAKIGKDSKIYYDNIIKWASSENKAISKIIVLVSYVTPVIWLALVMAYGFTQNPDYSRIATAVFFLNLLLMGGQFKKIQQELIHADKVQKVINQYSLIISGIEKENYTSSKLKDLQAKLKENQIEVSTQIKKLSKLFSGIESVKNVFGAAILNGAFLYHLHVLNGMYKWRKAFSSRVPFWLDTIGEIEALNSLANFSYNNSSFVFPEINNRFEISFEELGHPLISDKKRVCNSVNFNKEKFIILTGSNMAGKSTFLRTIGTNMILSVIGSAICASAANVHPLPVLVSMRLSDSLHDNESYFFKEVKRLKEIMTRAEGEICFVILDEILRGTNSDDKRNGTIGVIKKIIEKKAVGAIATHDLEICNTTDEYPGLLANKCFEVEIVNDELSFDFKLRDGICKNKSATFLMKKMAVI